MADRGKDNRPARGLPAARWPYYGKCAGRWNPIRYTLDPALSWEGIGREQAQVKMLRYGPPYGLEFVRLKP